MSRNYHMEWSPRARPEHQITPMLGMNSYRHSCDDWTEEETRADIDEALVYYLCGDPSQDSTFADREIPEPGIYSEPYVRNLIVRAGDLTRGRNPYMWHNYGSELFEEFLEALCYAIKIDTERTKKRMSLALVAKERPDFPLEQGILDMIAGHLCDKSLPRMP
jgi:hypothetical protein